MLTHARQLALLTLVLGAMPLVLAAQTGKPLPYQDPHLPTEQRVNDLVSRMTLDEKASQLVNKAAAIPRLGVPAYDWWSEGLHGIARSGYATLFPQAIGMAATWDTSLLGRESTVISIEARAKFNEAIRHDIHSIFYGLTIWSPNINIFRDPRWGRGQETYGEDPFLTAKLGDSFVVGLQGDNPKYFRAIATPKHYAVHSGAESERHRFNVDPTPHDLWDTYLPAFRSTIVDAKADSIMCAYNSIDGSPACANKELLETVLRHDWNFQGFVTSDCGAIDDFFSPTGHHFSTSREAAAVAGIRTGTDTNCGNTYLALPAAVKQGLIQESELDVSLRRLFTARFKLGLFDPDSMNPYAGIPFSVVGSLANHALALDAARKSMVLLKNDSGALPLKASTKTIAVVGPNAESLPAIEGNYNTVPKDPVLPIDGIAAEFKNAKVLYAQGSSYADGVAVPVPRTYLHPSAGSSAQGLLGEYFPSDNFNGKPVLTRVDKQIDFDWNSARPVPGVPSDRFAVRWSGTITVPEAGSYDFKVRLVHCYACGAHEHYAVYLDGKEMTAGITSPKGDTLRPDDRSRFSINFADTQPHQLRIEYLHHAPLFGAGMSLEWLPKPGLLEKYALAASKQADAVVVFLGLSPDLEGEEMPVQVEGFSGGDRTDIKLPSAQEHLLEALSATGKPLIVVLMNGSALAVNWAKEHANAILEAWYPGEGGAQAIAETLSGKNNPGGRLPVTFYKSIDDLPAFTDYSMSNRTYRYFKGAPLYAFGYGLSYTTFAYSTLHLSTNKLQAGDTLFVEAVVKNTGSRAGDEVAELYLAPPHTDVSPKLALVGFTRVHLAPGESKHLHFQLDPRALSQVDDHGVRAVDAGAYTLYLGGSLPTDSTEASSKTLQAPFTIHGAQQIPH